MGCICGLMRRRKSKPVVLHSVGKEPVVWPEDRVQKTPDLPSRLPKILRVEPMNFCGR